MVYVTSSDTEAVEVLKNSGLDYTILGDQHIIGYCQAQKIGIPIFREASLIAPAVGQLSRNMRVGVTLKQGNFCVLEGGGVVYADGNTVTYTPS